MVRTNTVITKFQAKIILLTFIPMATLVVFNFILLFVLYSAVVNIILSPQSTTVLVLEIQKTCVMIIGVMVLIFIGALFWVFVESGRMVGAFERLIRELNTINDPSQVKPLMTRKQDTFAKEIASMINGVLQDWASGKK